MDRGYLPSYQQVKYYVTARARKSKYLAWIPRPSGTLRRGPNSAPRNQLPQWHKRWNADPVEDARRKEESLRA